MGTVKEKPKQAGPGGQTRRKEYKNERKNLCRTLPRLHNHGLPDRLPGALAPDRLAWFMKRTGRKDWPILKYYGYKKADVLKVKEDWESITIMVKCTGELVHLRR